MSEFGLCQPKVLPQPTRSVWGRNAVTLPWPRAARLRMAQHRRRRGLGLEDDARVLWTRFADQPSELRCFLGGRPSGVIDDDIGASGLQYREKGTEAIIIGIGQVDQYRLDGRAS